jgi:hypothetical protein
MVFMYGSGQPYNHAVAHSYMLAGRGGRLSGKQEFILSHKESLHQGLARTARFAISLMKAYKQRKQQLISAVLIHVHT